MKAIILDDDPVIVCLLEKLLVRRGYEVKRYACPPLCPVYQNEMCDCSETDLCADVIITDFEMPFVKGTEFIERMRAKGCKCKHVAMMSGSWTPENLENAISMNIKIFHKPFALLPLENWLTEVEKEFR